MFFKTNPNHPKPDRDRDDTGRDRDSSPFFGLNLSLLEKKTIAERSHGSEKNGSVR